MEQLELIGRKNLLRFILALLINLWLIGGLTLITHFIVQQDWNAVVFSTVMVFAGIQLVYWYSKVKTLLSHRRQMRNSIVFQQPRSSADASYPVDDNPPTYEEIMKADPPPPAYYDIISELLKTPFLDDSRKSTKETLPKPHQNPQRKRCCYDSPGCPHATGTEDLVGHDAVPVSDDKYSKIIPGSTRKMPGSTKTTLESTSTTSGITTTIPGSNKPTSASTSTKRTSGTTSTTKTTRSTKTTSATTSIAAPGSTKTTTGSTKTTSATTSITAPGSTKTSPGKTRATSVTTKTPPGSPTTSSNVNIYDNCNPISTIRLPIMRNLENFPSVHESL